MQVIKYILFDQMSINVMFYIVHMSQNGMEILHLIKLLKISVFGISFFSVWNVNKSRM